MIGKHKARIEETIHQLIAELLVRRVKDPRVANVSVTHVETSKDYTTARVMYNVIGGGDDLVNIQKGLESCKGFIRSRIKKRIRMRVIPELVFIYDASLDRAMEIERLLKNINSEAGPPGEGMQDE